MPLSDEVADLEYRYKCLLNRVEEAELNSTYHEMRADELRRENTELLEKIDLLENIDLLEQLA